MAPRGGACLAPLHRPRHCPRHRPIPTQLSANNIGVVSPEHAPRTALRDRTTTYVHQHNLSKDSVPPHRALRDGDTIILSFQSTKDGGVPHLPLAGCEFVYRVVNKGKLGGK